MHACIPAHRRLRQENGEFEANQGYLVRPYLKRKKQVPSLVSFEYLVHLIQLTDTIGRYRKYVGM
jgi:hypothetical protein